MLLSVCMFQLKDCAACQDNVNVLSTDNDMILWYGGKLFILNYVCDRVIPRLLLTLCSGGSVLV
jgi:hypothetical protein